MIVKIPSVAGGIVADEVPHELPVGVWSDGLNVRFTDGYVQRTDGHAEILTQPSAAAYHIAPYQTVGKKWWIHATLTAAFADDGTTKTDITGTALTGAAGDKFTSTVIGGVFVINNQVDVPQYWNGDTATNLATLTGWNANWKCKSIRAFKNYLIALNVSKSTTNYPHMVKWSDAAAPGAIPASWDETDATKDAGERDLAETEDEIVDGYPLGDTFVVYKQRSMYGMQYIGGNSIFRSFRLPGNYGALTQNCVAQTPLGHVVLTPGPDVVIHNGNEPQSILSGKWRKWLRSNIQGDQFSDSFVVAMTNRDEVWVCFTSTGNTSPSRALIWNYKENTFTVRSLPSVTSGAVGFAVTNTDGTWAADVATWAADTTVWNPDDLNAAQRRMLMCTVNSEIFVMDSGDTFDGTAISANVERKGLHFDSPDVVKTVRAVYPRIDGTGTVYIQAGGAMDIEGTYTWSSQVAYTIGTSYKADTFATGRFLALRISSDSTASWRLRSIDLDIVPRGTY